MTEPVYVRYVFLTKKGLELMEIVENIAQSDVAIERIPKEDGLPPLPPKRMRKLEESP